MLPLRHQLARWWSGTDRHKRVVRSQDPVITRRPSGLKFATHTSSVSPSSNATVLPVATSQTRAVLSLDAVNKRRPSGLNSRFPHDVGMPGENSYRLAGLGVPDTRRMVVGRGRHAPTIGAELAP